MGKFEHSPIGCALARDSFVHTRTGHDFGVNDHGKSYSGKATGLRIDW
jgi:hypothetical protein